MLNRLNPALYGAGRVLPLRSEQFFLSPSGTLALRTQIWFTPEIIIWDCLCVLKNLFWFWFLFRRLVSRFALRVLIIACLIFLIVGFADFGDEAAANVANTNAENQTIKKVGNPQMAAKIVASASPIFTWPVGKTYTTSGFSHWHKGIDIPNPYGSPVHPTAAGVVISAGWDGGFGKTVVVQHSAGFISRYSHLSEISATAGQKINNASTIGAVGATGFATGFHLHFEIYQKGLPTNPLNILP